jgi:outer membrane protein insertion porin family
VNLSFLGRAPRALLLLTFAALLPAAGFFDLAFPARAHAQAVEGDGDGDGVGPRGPAPRVERIQFRGNRKVEDDAIRVNLTLKVGQPLDPEKIRDDVRALWKMGFFENVSVEATQTDSGGLVLTFVLEEKPSVRKIYIQGSKEVELEKINEVIDLKRDAILDVAKIKKNVEKVRELYVSKGFYLASVDYQVRPVNEAEVDVWLLVDEQAKVEIRRVSFIGNKLIPEAELRGIISTREGGYFGFLTDAGTYSEEAFERDLAIITAYYYDNGFINVKVAAPQITLSKDKRGMYIAVPIDEGPVFSIGKIDFKGDLIGKKQDYFDRLGTVQGETFSRSRLGRDLVALTDYYRDRGFAYVNITPLTAVDIDKRIVDVTFEIEKGQKVYFERINIRGNSKTRDKVIRREMKIAEGELYNQTNLETSRRRITALGFFEKVDITTKRGSSDEFIEVNVEIEEKPTGTFQIGAGFSSVENFIAQAQISQNNLFGRGQTLALQAQLSGLRQLFLLRFVEPYFLDSDWFFAFSIYNQTRVQTNFARNSVGGDLTWGYPLSYESRLSLTYKAEAVDVSTQSRGVVLSGAISQPVAESSVANLFRGGVTSSLRGSWSYDSRDNRLFPTRGWFHNAFVEVADTYTLSQNVFTRFGGFSRYYRPIYGPFILKLNAEVGVVTSRDPDGVPITERYFVGGINDVRGFRPRTLGPRILIQSPGEPSQLGSLPLGGNLQVIWNSEVEFPLFQRVGISGVVFFDAGNAYNLEDKWCANLGDNVQVSAKENPCFDVPGSLVSGIRRSVGFGVRWFSPLGPLRFEWGIPLDRQRNEESLVFEFTIGNFF